MNACGCGRANDARRSYCGGCGTRIARACARCQFVNATDDAYCGGCGDALGAGARAATTAAAVVVAPRPAVAPTSADTMSAAELASLLGKAAAPTPVQLPAIVSQDDLDRLFGGVA